MSGERVESCATCKHWTPPGERTDFKNVYRDADTLFGRCELIDLADDYDDTPSPIPLAVTQDGSNYRADLFTQAEFGCVLHELADREDRR